MGLSNDRMTPFQVGEFFRFPLATGAKVFAGGLVAINSGGYAVAASTATGLVAVGRAEETVDNTAGQNGDLYVKVRRGVFRYKNSADTDLIARAQIGQVCYVVDDETVAKTSDGAARSPAGQVLDVDTDGVWVLVGWGPVVSPAGTLAAANNLSDVADKPTARANLAANKVLLELDIADLVASDAKVYRAVAPVAGVIYKIWSVLEGHALAAGDATLTAKIGSTLVTTGVITITQSASAIGDVDSCTPSAAKTVSAGDVISITVGGANTDTDAKAKVSLEIQT